MKFFKPFLEFLGYNPGQVIRDPNGQRLTVNVLPDLRGVGVNIWEAKPEYARHRFEVYEVGLHHLAFHVEKREQVDQVHELVRKLGAEILDGPGNFLMANRTAGMQCIFLDPIVSSSRSSTCREPKKPTTKRCAHWSAGREARQTKKSRCWPSPDLYPGG